MSHILNSTQQFHEEESREPITIKLSYKEEIYQGNELRSRIELIKTAKIPEYPRQFGGPSKLCSSLPQLEFIDDNQPKSDGKSQCLEMNGHGNNSSTNSEKKRRNCLFQITNVLAVILISVIIGRYLIPFNIFFNEPILIDKVELELYSNILNQNDSIASVMQSLKLLHEPPVKKILTCLVGPNGVGKSHLVNILGKEINPNIIEIFHQSNLPALCDKGSSISKRLRLKLYFTDFLIIVIDDLKMNDLDSLQQFIESTFAIDDINILILTLFNTETEGCLKDPTEITVAPIYIKDKLANSSKYFFFSHFNNLDIQTARLWLKKTLTMRNVALEDHDRIIDRLLRAHDIRCHGLKGLNSKMFLELS